MSLPRSPGIVHTVHEHIPGLPATGRRFSLGGATILDLQDGKIKRCSDYGETATFLKQIGSGRAPGFCVSGAHGRA
jgi:hypothetical protein